MPLQVIRQDISKVRADAIVSASGHSFASHGAVSTAVFRAAGPGLQEECDRKGCLDVAEVLVTGAYGLPAKFVIHTVGPSWQEGQAGEERLLRQCYENCMNAAWEKGCRSIAFPLISSGGYHFPKEHALQNAMEALADNEHFDEMDVTLAVYDRSSFEVSRELLTDISDFLGDSLTAGLAAVGRFPEERRRRQDLHRLESCIDDALPELQNEKQLLSESCVCNEMEKTAPPALQEKCRKNVSERSSAGTAKQKTAGHAERIPADIPPELAKQLGYLDESFSEMLNRLILERDVKSSAIYKAANVSKAVFSNIFTKKGYRVKKGTALALAIALHLDLDETKVFIAKAGHALSDAFRQDKVVEYFIVHKIYNIYRINEVLFACDLPELGEKTW